MNSKNSPNIYGKVFISLIIQEALMAKNKSKMKNGYDQSLPKGKNKSD